MASASGMRSGSILTGCQTSASDWQLPANFDRREWCSLIGACDGRFSGLKFDRNALGIQWVMGFRGRNRAELHQHIVSTTKYQTQEETHMWQSGFGPDGVPEAGGPV